MRKFLYYFSTSFWLSFTGIIVVIVFAFMLNACAGISFKEPTTQILTNAATYLAGYEIGKAEPELANEFIKYTQTDREDILAFFESWKRYLASRLVDDPVHRKLIKEMLGLVEVDLQLKSPVEQEEIIRELFREFIDGLEVGIDARQAL